MWTEKIYPLLPLSMQNAAASWKGWHFHRQRYQSASFRELSRTLLTNEALSAAAMAELQFTLFRKFADYCYSHSPYYRRLWKAHSVHPEDIRHPDDIRLIPIVSKQALRERTRDFLTRPVDRTMTVVHTSGTTGSPVTVYFSKDDIGRRYAFLERCRRWAGVRIGQRRASFTGRNLIPQTQRTAPFWRRNYPGNQLLFSSYHLSAQNLPDYIDALERFQPEMIDGYPSAIHIVADHIQRHGGSRIRPKAILVSAETVLPHQRETIEAAFQTKLYNQYASSEGAPFISECRMGRLHIQSDSGVIEILDRNGNRAEPGEIGQMVVTSFTTHVVPMLRFAIEDTAIPSSQSQPCQCGLPFPVVEEVMGRVDDFLFTSERGFVGRMDTVFKGLPSTIAEAQIVQTTPETIVLRLVPMRPSYKPEHGRTVVAEMRKKLGDGVAIELEEFERLPRSANGKLRAVVNQCKHLLPPAFQADPPREAILDAADRTVVGYPLTF